MTIAELAPLLDDTPLPGAGRSLRRVCGAQDTPQRRWQRRQVERGRCPICGEPAADGCQACDRHRAQQQQYNLEAKWRRQFARWAGDA